MHSTLQSHVGVARLHLEPFRASAQRTCDAYRASCDGVPSVIAPLPRFDLPEQLVLNSSSRAGGHARHSVLSWVMCDHMPGHGAGADRRAGQPCDESLSQAARGQTKMEVKMEMKMIRFPFLILR